MKRTGFKPRTPHRGARDPDRVRATPTVTPGAFRVPGPVDSAPAARVEKSAPVRSEALRRIKAMGLWPKALPLQNFSTGDDLELTRKNRT